MITREEAITLLKKHGAAASLLRHSLASEAVLKAMAARLGKDCELWSITGLLHDLDYPETENNPSEHGICASHLLKGLLPQEAIDAIKRHNSEYNGCEPETVFDYALRAGESVTGLIYSAALMRPDGYNGMTVKSIKKKIKDKAFAASVNRDNIRQCENAGISLDDFLALAIEAMAEISDEIKQ